jgi:NADH-quinone oxidoreductase subunit L
LVATLAIAGIPPFAGFFSKDEILWKVFSTGHPAHWILGLITAGMTAFYMFRQLYMTFYGEPRMDHHTREHLKESPPMIVFPLVALAALSLLGGLVGVPEFLGGGNWIEHWLSPVFYSQGAETAHHAEGNLELILALVSVAVAVCGILLAYGVYIQKRISAEKLASFAGGIPYRLVSNLYFLDQIYGFVFVKGTFLLSAVGAWIDRVIIDGIVDGVAKVTTLTSQLNGWIDNRFVDGLVNGIANLIFAVGQRVRMIQTGSINGYLYVVLAAVVVVMALRLAY